MNAASRIAVADAPERADLPLPEGPDAWRFRVAPGQGRIKAGIRHEARDVRRIPPGSEIWCGFETALPASLCRPGQPRVVVAQWHEQMPLDGVHRRPPLAHRIVDGALLVTLWNDAAFAASDGLGDGLVACRGGAWTPDVFHGFVYRIVWSADRNGRVDGWTREGAGPWRRHVAHAGAIGFGEALAYYFKLGIYTVHDITAPMHALHRRYRLGDSAAAIGFAAPD